MTSMEIMKFAIVTWVLLAASSVSIHQTASAASYIIVVPNENPFSAYTDMKHAQQNLAADCQNMSNATLNLAKFTTLSDPNLTNAVAQYNRDCAKITGPFDIQKMIATNNAMVTDCQNVKISTENLSRYAPSNDPHLVSGLSQYNNDCAHLTGPLNLLPAGSDEMTVSCQNEKAAVLNLARYTTLNDPRLVNEVLFYNRDCGNITGPLNMLPPPR